MITTAILNTLFLPIYGIVQLIPSFSLTIPNNFYDALHSLTYGLAFVLPLGVLFKVFAFRLAVRNFHLIWALILRVKSFIPTMGD